jgi:probable rRNA maturation factor
LIVDFSVEEGVAASWDEPRITSLIASIVDRERSTATEHEISVHLVGDATIRELNAEHRQIDTVTDVLSFPLAEPGFVLPEGEPVHLGDVVISYPRAVAQANEYGHSVEREVAYLVAHGVLHVLGYDHEERSERERMRHKEEEALQPLGFTR